jgi:epoxyqueuosine reductase
VADAIARIREAARRQAFDLVGVTGADVLARDLDRLVAWTAAGHHGDMGWMARDPPQRADPETVLRGVRSMVTVAVPHSRDLPPRPGGDRAMGRVARYAWGLDYHDVLLARLRALAADLPAALGRPCRAKAAVDHSPILDRAVAVRAGLGFFGKNTCVLLPRRGSYYLLGELLVDVELPPTPPARVEGCGTCTRCLPACPTGAIVAPFVLDARRCISYWTIELRGSIPREQRPSMGDWVFGCDVCQEVCPFNRFEPAAPWPELEPARGVGAYLDLEEALAVTDDDAFRHRYAGTPLLRPGRGGLLRNAAVAARNAGAARCVPRLARLVREDVDPVVREHALWALQGLDPGAARGAAEGAVADAAPSVADEARRILDGEA